MSLIRMTTIFLVLVGCGSGRATDSDDTSSSLDMGTPFGDECDVPIPCDAGDCAADMEHSQRTADAGPDAGLPTCGENEMCVRGHCEPDPEYYRDERCEPATGATLLGVPLTPFRLSPPDQRVDKFVRVIPGGDRVVGLWTPSGEWGPLYVAVATLDPPIVSEPVKIGSTSSGEFDAVWAEDGWVVAWGDPPTGAADNEVGFFVRKVMPDLTMGDALSLNLGYDGPTAMAANGTRVAVGAGSTQTYIVDATAPDLAVDQQVQRDFRYPPGIAAWNGRFVWAGISEAQLKIVSGLAEERSEKTWAVEWIGGSPGGPGATRATVVGNRFTGLLQSRRGAQAIEIYELSVDLSALDGGTIPQNILGTWDLPTSTAPWNEVTSIATNGTSPFAAYYTQSQEVPVTAVFELGEVPRGPDAAGSCAPCGTAAHLASSDGTIAVGWGSGQGGAACGAIFIE